MAPAELLSLVLSILNALGILPIIQIAAVVMAAVAVARWFMSRS